MIRYRTGGLKYRQCAFYNQQPYFNTDDLAAIFEMLCNVSPHIVHYQKLLVIYNQYSNGLSLIAPLLRKIASTAEDVISTTSQRKFCCISTTGQFTQTFASCLVSYFYLRGEVCITRLYLDDLSQEAQLGIDLPQLHQGISRRGDCNRRKEQYDLEKH